MGGPEIAADDARISPLRAPTSMGQFSEGIVVTTTESLATIMIPAYRASAFLPRAVRSVLGKTMHDWQLVVVADDDVDYDMVLREDAVIVPQIRFAST